MNKIPKTDYITIAARWKAAVTRAARSEIISTMATEYGSSRAAIYYVLGCEGVEHYKSLQRKRREVLAVERRKPRPQRNDATPRVQVVDKALLMRGTGQPHRAPLRLPPLGITV